MVHIRSMGYSITPKMHGMESHVLTQMRTIPGGIGKLMEHWIEQYIKLVSDLTWLIVVLEHSVDKLQFDQVLKKMHATHGSN